MPYSVFYIKFVGSGEILPKVHKYLSKGTRSAYGLIYSQRNYRTYSAALKALDAIEQLYVEDNKTKMFPRLIKRDDDLLLVSPMVFRIRSIVKYGKDS